MARKRNLAAGAASAFLLAAAIDLVAAVRSGHPLTWVSGAGFFCAAALWWVVVLKWNREERSSLER